ncbi:MAG: response regulator, partial [Alphaproteobacteria bacterium]|nr:response regulator [Alphaproteobacteria bacterium]
ARRLEAVRSIHQRIVEASADLVLVVDRAGVYVHVSPSSLPILGHRPEDMIGRNGVEFVHPDDLELTRAELRKTRRTGQTCHFEARYAHKDGRAVSLAWAGLWSETDQRYFFTGRDMTERNAAEAQLRQAQKMEVVGQLTGGVAHDFNNLLGVVVGNLDLLKERVDAATDAESVELLGEALDAALRGADVTRQLLAFSRRQPLQPKRVDPNQTVRTMAKLLRRAIGAAIEVRLVLPDDVWPVLIDPAQLESALLNLAVNARDAMPQGGTLTIETANCTFDTDDDAAAYIDRPAGDYLVVAVSDTGSGMPPEIVARAFEPFFSTKGVGKGTGLGLSMVYGFVKQSGGDARIYSEPGRGTTIRLYLPRAQTGTGPADRVEAEAAGSRGGERVLVVEDNPALRRLSARQLRDLGYAVIEAANGPEALAMLGSGVSVELLFTDVVMPGGLDGQELAQRAQAMRPGLKVLFTSGFTAAAGTAGDVALADRLLTKPFRKADLARRVRAILDA